VVTVDSWWNGLVHDRSAAVLELVIISIADDYERLEIILNTINKGGNDWGPEHWPARNAVPVSRREVIHALHELTREGYAQAYLLGSGEAESARFQENGIEDLWFDITPKGRGAIKRLYGGIPGLT
jgi:hypothetical protein